MQAKPVTTPEKCRVGQYVRKGENHEGFSEDEQDTGNVFISAGTVGMANCRDVCIRRQK